jgi:hypothetical protein
MNLIAERLQKLDEMIRQLTEDYHRIKTDNELLTHKTVEQQQIIEQQREETEHLKKQVQALMIARSVENNHETDRVKSKIQDLVREIDRCIELLNK